MDERRRGFLEGYRNGRLDKLYRLSGPSMVALTCPEHNVPGYAEGYRTGYYSPSEQLDEEWMGSVKVGNGPTEGGE